MLFLPETIKFFVISRYSDSVNFKKHTFPYKYSGLICFLKNRDFTASGKVEGFHLIPY